MNFESSLKDADKLFNLEESGVNRIPFLTHVRLLHEFLNPNENY